MQLKFPNQNLYIHKFPYTILDTTTNQSSISLLNDIKEGNFLNYDNPIDKSKVDIVNPNDDDDINYQFNLIKDNLDENKFKNNVKNLLAGTDLKVDDITSESYRILDASFTIDELHWTAKFLVVLVYYIWNYEVDNTKLLVIWNLNKRLHNKLWNNLYRNLLSATRTNIIIQLWGGLDSIRIYGQREVEPNCIVEIVDNNVFYDWLKES